MTSTDLVNKYVHKHLDEGFLVKFPKHRYVNNQGIIKSIVSRDNYGTPSAYEVEWYDCLHGYPHHSEIVLTEQMLFENWSFYDDHDQWIRKFEESCDLQILNNDMLREAP